MRKGNIAIIPARGGSKRIPRKNVKEFLGKPVIAYSIQKAIDSDLFDDIIVSTDDDEIAEISKSYGASVPFMRSAKNAGDHSSTVDVLLEVIESCRESGIIFSYGCCIYPAAPLISSEILVKGYSMMFSKGYDSLFPVVPFGYPVWRGMRIEDGTTGLIWPENMLKRSQDLETVFHDAGQFYWFNTEALVKSEKLFMPNSGSLILSENEVQDIDTEIDWQIAEIKYSLLNDQG